MRNAGRLRWAVGIGGDAFEARKRPRAFFRFERTRTMVVLGREGVFWASMRAWRFVTAFRAVSHDV